MEQHYSDVKCPSCKAVLTPAQVKKLWGSRRAALKKPTEEQLAIANDTRTAQQVATAFSVSISSVRRLRRLYSSGVVHKPGRPAGQSKIALSTQKVIASAEGTPAEIAKRFGVSPGTVSRMRTLHGRTESERKAKIKRQLKIATASGTAAEVANKLGTTIGVVYRCRRLLEDGIIVKPKRRKSRK